MSSPPLTHAHTHEDYGAGRRAGGAAVAFRDSRIVDVASMDELRAVVEDGRWARAGWAGSDADEARVKEETGATFRCYPFQQPAGGRPCVVTGAAGAEVAIFAKAY